MAVEEWSQGMAGISGEQIKRGLDEWNEDWPPSLPEFVDTCLGKRKGLNGFGLNYTPECYREHPKVPHDKRLSSDERNKLRKEMVDKHLPGLRDALK